MKNKEFCIGLDIGTSSTGYAMTDMDGKLLKHQGRSTFGAVLFDEATTASDRRMKRSARRRLDRREQRIDLLQALLAAEVAKADPVFFIRLNESFLQDDDRRYPLLYGTLPKTPWTDGTSCALPTVYHLRSALVHEDRQADIRYVYLALHHIIKYRGHFLMEGESLNDASADAAETIRRILEALSAEPYSFTLEADPQTAEKIKDALQLRNATRTAKAEQIVTLLRPDRDSKKAAKALAALWVGGSGSLEDLFGYDGEDPANKISFADDFDEDSYIDCLGVAGEIFTDILDVYRWQLFSSLRAEGETISQTMIRRYLKHRRDLKALKAWVRKYAPGKYYSFFREAGEKTVNYCTYSGHFKQRDLKGKAVKTPSQADFYKAVKSLLTTKDPEGAAEAVPMLKDMEEENGFLPLLRIYLNGAIPNQLHAEELSMILDRQGEYYPVLKENKDKIMQLCTFRLPYYVGPLNVHSPFQKWLVRSDEKPVTPWNFDRIVNRVETADGFIRNLTNKCTYIPTEDVLPLHSLLYEEYLLLDELNRVRVNEKLIPIKLKERIIEELFRRRKKVSKKAFIDWLKKNTAYVNADDIVVAGLREDSGFAASLSSYIDFTSWGFDVDENTAPMIEQLILWSTVFENRGILREKIRRSYPQLNDKQVNCVCRKRYSGWGRLSRMLLDGITGSDMAENATVIDMMRQTNDNFMRVINEKRFGFDKALEELGMAEKAGRITLAEVQALPGSPALKRGIWQAVRIVEELAHNRGCAPKAIYIENTRNEDEGKKGRRVPDRISALEKLYSEMTGLSPDAAERVKECGEELKALKKDKVRLTDRQFLYFIQLGKCMYSGRRLNFSELERYDIDHVLPQSYIKDDSIDNRVLVMQNENRRKAGSLLLDGSVIDRMKPFWNMLLQKGLVSRKKFNNLTRTAVEDRDKVGFINRQLVETSQIIRHVILLFKTHYPDTDVRGVNARLSSDLRDAYDLYKVRELNDTHHAFDAFLACTVGTFTAKYMNWLTDESVAASMARENWLKMIGNAGKNKHGMVIGIFNRDQVDEETGEVLRDAAAHIRYLKQVWGYRDHFIVYKKEENNGAFFDETRYPAGAIEAKWPLRKDLPTEKYGGFNSIKPAYIAAITYSTGKGRKGMLVNVPVLIAGKAASDTAALADYFEKALGLGDVRIIRKKILLNQKINYKGSDLLLRSRREARNAKVLYLPKEQVILLNKISKHISLSEVEISQLDELLTLILDKINNLYPVYSGIRKRILQSSVKLTNLIQDEKEKIIFEFLKLTQLHGQPIQLKTIGVDSDGRIQLSFDIKDIIFIDQSVTGFYERRTRLWDSGQS